VLASASPWRARIAPRAEPDSADGYCAGALPAVVDRPALPKKKESANTYRPWAHLPRRTFAVERPPVSGCNGRMKLLAMVTEHASIVRFLERAPRGDDAPRPPLGPQQ